MDLKDEITTILHDKNMWGDGHCRVEKIDRGYEITYGFMYESPNLSFAILMKLSELFGTEEIDVDDFAYKGCDTCDYGSSYGHEIQVYNPTKNVSEMDSLVGSDLLA